MDWKDILSQKIADGELEREESAEDISSSQPSIKPVLEIILDKKGRKGKTATLIVGFDCDDSELKEIASALKSKLSTGGSARGNEILIQGDRREDAKKFLKELGYKVK